MVYKVLQRKRQIHRNYVIFKSQGRNFRETGILAKLRRFISHRYFRFSSGQGRRHANTLVFSISVALGMSYNDVAATPTPRQNKAHAQRW